MLSKILSAEIDIEENEYQIAVDKIKDKEGYNEIEVTKVEAICGNIRNCISVN